MFSLIDLDKLQGVILNPFAFYFPIQRGFSGPIQTLAYERTDSKPTNLGAIVFLGIALQRLHCYRFIDFC